jgi:iron complex transport system substrate-binding protein
MTFRPLGRARGVFLACAALLVPLCACDRAPGSSAVADSTAVEPSGPDTLVDAAGRTYVFTSPPRRIVSLVPSATAVLLRLGQQAHLAGRTDFDTAQAIAKLPSVGGGISPNLEALVAMQPDLVIRFEGPSDKATTEQLDRMGIAHFSVRPESTEDIRRIIEDLGRMTDRTKEAAALLTGIEHAIEFVQTTASTLPPVRAAIVLGGSPPYVAGPGTYLHELISIGGGINVFADLTELYAAVSPESALGRRPDVFITFKGTTIDPRITRGTPVREVGGWVQIPGPDLGAAAYEIARALHPDAFP